MAQSESSDPLSKSTDSNFVTSNGVNNKDVDIYRDTPVRYLGYANEVGEAFRALVHVNLVRFSYAVASTYVCADAYHKGSLVSKGGSSTSEVEKRTAVRNAVLDTFLWQGLASVAIPGFTINRICFVANYVLQKASSLPPATRKWTTTAIGLSCIPLIIKPIDSAVHILLDNSTRKYLNIRVAHDN